ncbi:MAG: tetratricopeptide repeat protein [Muribaculaceae bacterium]|nr:tetratricopeptide repeat protein [Muribaculaceae bacterium]
MTLNELKLQQNQIRSALAGLNVLAALNAVEQLVDNSGDYALRQRLDTAATAYRYMLQYVSQGAHDPEREKVLTDTVTALYEISDRAVASLAAPLSLDLFYTRRNADRQTPLSQLLASYRQARNKIELLSAAEGNDAVVDDLNRQCEQIEVTAFNSVWTSFPTTADDAEIVRQSIAADDIPSHFKCLLLSALLLGITKFFDSRKFFLLCDAYELTADHCPEVAARAIVAIVISLSIYRNRLRWRDDVGLRLEALARLTHWQNDLQIAFTRLVRARNTENISRAMSEDLIPDIKKLTPEMLKSMRRGKNPEETIIDLEENPQWSKWLKDSGIERKMQEFNDMHLEGDDVYISTFSNLKFYPFFNSLANWFMPFHLGHTAVTSASQQHQRAMARVLEQMPMLCNSDKYSIFLSLSSMPEQQQQLMAQQFSQQQDALNEIRSTEAIPEQSKRDLLLNTYIKDLYRFFKLFSRKQEFYQVFNTNFSLFGTPFIESMLDNPTLLSTIGEFYFKNGFYADAIDYFTALLERGGADAIYYQKIGFAHQSLGNHREAIEAYKKYVLVDEADVWNLRHLAACYRALGDNEAAIDFYNRALNVKPDNVGTLLNLARTLLDAGNIAEATKCYYKVDFLDDKRHRAWRPLAWCLMLAKNYDQAENYYRKIIDEDKPSAADQLNYGHLLLITGRLKDAADRYALAIAALDGNTERFNELLRADRPFLHAANVPDTLIAIASQAAQRMLT